MSVTEHETDGSVQPQLPRINAAVFEYYGSLKRLHSFITEHIAESLPLSLAANIVGMAPPSFSRFFRRRTGVTYKTYLDTLRIERAELLIQYSDSSILEIGINCGLADPTTFTRTYHRLRGTTPSDFRKR